VQQHIRHPFERDTGIIVQLDPKLLMQEHISKIERQTWDRNFKEKTVHVYLWIRNTLAQETQQVNKLDMDQEHRSATVKAKKKGPQIDRQKNKDLEQF
jgi:hypothetical protein